MTDQQDVTFVGFFTEEGEVSGIGYARTKILCWTTDGLAYRNAHPVYSNTAKGLWGEITYIGLFHEEFESDPFLTLGLNPPVLIGSTKSESPRVLFRKSQISIDLWTANSVELHPVTIAQPFGRDALANGKGQLISEYGVRITRDEPPCGYCGVPTLECDVWLGNGSMCGNCNVRTRRSVNYRGTPYTFEECRGFWAAKGHDVNALGEPLPNTQTFQKSALEADGKTTMAHVMVMVGAFASVGEAKRNGWGKPLIVGTHCVTKRNVTFEIIAG